MSNTPRTDAYGVRAISDRPSSVSDEEWAEFTAVLQGWYRLCSTVEAELSGSLAEFIKMESMKCEEAKRADGLRDELLKCAMSCETFKIALEKTIDQRESFRDLNTDLAIHLSRAMAFIRSTYGHADRGIIQAGRDKATAFDVDAASAAIAKHRSP